jgi:hypothetical protein
MTPLPHSQYGRRSARLRPAEHTPAVLRLENGSCTTGELQVVSLTGGLLGVPTPLRRSLPIKVLFITTAGPVLGTAEMLDPLTYCQQPFRFVEMDGQDLCRLQSAIHAGVYPHTEEDEWIRKYRTAVAAAEPPRRKFLPAIRIAVAVALLSFASALLVLHTHLLK